MALLIYALISPLPSNGWAATLVDDIHISGPHLGGGRATTQTGAADSLPGRLTNLNGTLIFTAIDGITGNDSTGGELYKSDGTAAGTVLVKDFNPGPAGAFFGFGSGFPLPNVNGTFFFGQLYKSDGTDAGTVLVRDLSPGSYPGSRSGALVPFNGSLYFSAHDGISGEELWKSDGTPGGAVLVKDADPGLASSNPTEITASGGMLYFRANTTDLWKSDGTAAGTVLVKTNVFVADTTAPVYMTDVNGTIFFVGEEGGLGEA